MNSGGSPSYTSALAWWLPSHPRGERGSGQRRACQAHRLGFLFHLCSLPGPPGPSRRCVRGGTWARCQWPGVGGDSERKQGGGDSGGFHHPPSTTGNVSRRKGMCSRLSVAVLMAWKGSHSSGKVLTVQLAARVALSTSRSGSRLRVITACLA